MGLEQTILIGDIHFGRNLFSGYDEKIISALKKILKKHSIGKTKKDLVFLGDIADKYTINLKPFFDLLFRFEDYYNIHLITGNHDIYNADKTSLDMLVWLKKYGKTQINVYRKPKIVDGTLFLPYPYTTLPDTSPNVAYAHFEQSGTVYDNGFVAKGDVLPTHDCQYYSGHLHVRQQHENIIYVGSIVPYLIKDDSKKYYHVIDGKGGISEHRIRSWVFREAVIHTDADLLNLDPKYYYSLILKSDKLNLKLLDNLNLVRYRTDIKIQVNNVADDNDFVQVDDMGYLKENYNLDKNQMKRAKKFLDLCGYNTI
jgi:hypothetical protein